MARRKAGPDADHFPWRRKVKRDLGTGNMLATKRHKASWCPRCPGATRRWMAGKKPLSEIVAEMVLVRCPRASTCTECMLQSALDIIMTLPSGPHHVGQLLKSIQAKAPNWPLELMTDLWLPKNVQIARTRMR